jgi:putative chitinase
MTTVEQLRAVCQAAPVRFLEAAAPHYNAALPLAEVTTAIREAMFLAQLAHESNEFRSFVENLSYSAERIAAVWPRRFRTAEAAQPYARSAEKLANKVYADRLGNGDEASGEGWRYRGRGAIQLTGHDNYARFARETGIDVLRDPDLLARSDYAFTAAAKFWIWNGLNSCADRGDVAACTRKIQGGADGLDKRAAYYSRAIVALGAEGSPLV